MKKPLMILVSLVAAALLIGDARCDTSSIDHDVYQIEHSIGDDAHDEFTQIGQVNLRQLKQTQNAVHYQSMESVAEQSNSGGDPAALKAVPLPIEQISTEIETVRLDQAQLDRIQAALSSLDHNPVYRVRMCKKALASSSLSAKCFTSTFTYLRSVMDANMSIQLTIHTGLNNNLNSISIKPWSTEKKKLASIDRVSVYANVQSIRQASGPDTESYLEKLRIEKEQKEKSAQSGNESFLSKYWIYIVPFVVIMFLMNIVNPEAGGAQGGGGGGGGGGAR